jgi:hypothetical protein
MAVGDHAGADAERERGDFVSQRFDRGQARRDGVHSAAGSDQHDLAATDAGVAGDGEPRRV